MASTPHDGSGTTFSFASTTYTVTNIVHSLSDVGSGDEIDISHLGMTAGNTVKTIARPLKGAAGGDTGKEIAIDFIGGAAIVGGLSGNLTITGGLAISVSNATCVSSSVTLALNEVIRGNATFRLP